MAKISNDFLQTLVDNHLIEHGDMSKIAQMTKQSGMKDGKGYTRPAIHYIIYNNTSTDENVIKLIMDYYTPKVEAIIKQREAVKNMKEKLQATL